MRKLVVVVAAGLAVLGFLALMPSPANAELKVSITGNMRLTGHIVDVIGRNGDAEEIAPTNIPFTAGPNKDRERGNHQTMIDARRSRLQAVISDEVGAIKLNAFYQGDFDTADGNAATSNARVFRMRLFWAQATNGPWILRFGQMRTIVSEFGDNLFGGVAAPDIVDENGHWDQLQARQPGIQVAYATKMMGGDLLVGVGMEKSASAVLTSTDLAATQGGTATNSAGTPVGGTFNATANGNVNPNQGSGEDVPMFGAAARYRTPLYAVFLRGAAQKHRVIYCAQGGSTATTTNCTQTGPNGGHETALTGWLGAIGVEVTPGPLTVYGQYYYADGLNRLGGTFSDVSSVAGGFVGQQGGPVQDRRQLKAIESHNWHAGAEYKLTKDLKAVVVYEFQNAVANRQIFNLTTTSTDKRDFQAVHAGFGYSFWSRFNFGLEYEWAKVHSFGSSEGTMNAVNSRLHFYF